MQRLMLFIVGLIAAYTLTGCITAQQLRERRIAQNHELFNAFNPDIQEKVRLGQIDLGFSQDMVRLAWGSPDRIYIRTTSDGVATVWTYTRMRTYTQTERMTIPVHVTDSTGKTRTEYTSVWVNRDTEEEYAAARVEFTQGIITAIEQLKP
jgi:hypothetical protein